MLFVCSMFVRRVSRPQCVDDNVCQCKNGFSGRDCKTEPPPICYDGCNKDHGKCTYNATSMASSCVCNAGWAGPSCNEPVCSVPCLHGKCSGPNTCTCEDGYTGMTCGIPPEAICEPGCGPKGKCQMRDKCMAYHHCTGADCHSVCTAIPKCICEDGWAGDDCRSRVQGNCFPECEVTGFCA
jgi:hypothetical protein